jgi:tetratricopeptide (TPR) repeat protein
MSNLEYIDDYFNGSPDDLQKQRFEELINNDVVFAEEVAFYVAAKATLQQHARQEKKERFSNLYRQQQAVPVVQLKPAKRVWKYLAAASVLLFALLLTWFVNNQKTSPDQLADTYIQQHLLTLPVTMGTQQDSLQTGLNLYKADKLPEALQYFEALLKNNPDNEAAKKYAGIVSLRLNDYDKALSYFKSLELNTASFSNPAKFYHALTLLKRNNTGDKGAAVLILQDVVSKDLEGKETAVGWLKKLE